MPRKRQKGFTLIELLVVIAIIGMLASIVLVSLGPARQRGRDARRKADIRQISTAMELCYDDSTCKAKEQYVTNDTADLANAIAKIDTGSGTSYMAPVPKDPSESGSQVYTWSKNDSTPTKYCVYTLLEAEALWIAASEKGTRFDLSSKPDTDLTTGTSPNTCC